MANQSNPSLSKVKSCFDAIAQKGTTVELTGQTDDYSETSESHLQGLAIYNGVYIIAMNRHGKDEGELFFYNASSNAFISSMKLPVEGNDTKDHDRSYNHPGGLQVIGDYLLIPIQTQDYENSVIQLWDISTLSTSSTAITLVDGNYLPAVNDKKIGGIGMANMGTYFILAAIDNDKVFFYKSNIVAADDPAPTPKLDIATATYTALFDAKMSREASAVNLITQDDGKLFLLAFASSTYWLITYKDWGLLYEVDLSGKKITGMDERHFISTADSDTFTGPHFRWGAASYMPSSTSLGLKTTQRVMQPKVKLETWTP